MIEPVSGRPDWFSWQKPPMPWCHVWGNMPGVQATGLTGDGQVLGLLLHRSHLPFVPPELVPAATSFRARAEAIACWLKDFRGVELRPYQLDDLPFLLERRGAMLGYEMRLGKTALACAVHDPRSGPLLIVGPLVARDVWAEWVERVFGWKLCVLAGRKNVVPQFGHPAYFVHFDVFEAHTPQLTAQPLGTLVLDEVQLLQSKLARRSQVASYLSAKASKVLGLTGTPIWSDPITLHPLLHLLNPGAWGTRHAFGAWYTHAIPNAHGWTYEGAANPEQLKARLAAVLRRRTRAQVWPDLPAVTRVVEMLPVTDRQLAAIEAAADRERRIFGHATVGGYLAKLRRKLGELKIPRAVELAVDASRSGRRMVVWCWHREVADKIVRGLEVAAVRNVFRIRAEDVQTVRTRSATDFRQTPAAVMVASIAVGGVAIDLSCDDVEDLFVELDYIPANNDQAASRTFSRERRRVITFLGTETPYEIRLFEALAVREDSQRELGLSESDIGRIVLGIAA